MFTNHTNLTGTNDDRPGVNWRAVSDIVGDLIGAVSIFATGYILLLAGHGFGLN